MENIEPHRQVRGTAVREKILATADALFYNEGVRAVGVDTIVERSAVAKTSLYRWFPTKDDLVAAFLERRNMAFWGQWDRVAAANAGAPRKELEAQLGWITRHIGSPGYRGCPFISTATEFPDLGHPSRAVCEANKQKLRDRLLGIASAAGAPRPEHLADQLLLLVDGAFANSQVLGKQSPVHLLAETGLVLMDAALSTVVPHARRSKANRGAK